MHSSVTAPYAATLIMLAAVTVTHGDVVERRGAEPELRGIVTLIDDAGVTVRSALGAVHLVPWDRVRRVQTERTDVTLAAHMEVAQDLWRARSRVERHDTTLAEPVLERLFEQFKGRTHETALVVAEGLVRCRVARADHVLAVIPALEVARLRRDGVTTEAYSTLPAHVDTTYALSMALAPVWLVSPGLDSLAHDLENFDAHGDEVVAALADAYRVAVLRVLGRAGEPAAKVPDHPGVDFLRRLNECHSGSADARSAAREQLRRAIPSMPRWAQAWARYHIGVSLLAENGVGRRQQGAVSLIHLPASFGRTHPFLAGLALAQVARAMKREGDAAAAGTLLNELQRTYPNHPLHMAGDRPAGDEPSEPSP